VKKERKDMSVSVQANNLYLKQHYPGETFERVDHTVVHGDILYNIVRNYFVEGENMKRKEIQKFVNLVARVNASKGVRFVSGKKMNYSILLTDGFRGRYVGDGFIGDRLKVGMELDLIILDEVAQYLRDKKDFRMVENVLPDGSYAYNIEAGDNDELADAYKNSEMISGAEKLVSGLDADYNKPQNAEGVRYYSVDDNYAVGNNCAGKNIAEYFSDAPAVSGYANVVGGASVVYQKNDFDRSVYSSGCSNAYVSLSNGKCCDYSKSKCINNQYQNVSSPGEYLGFSGSLGSSNLGVYLGSN